MLACVSEIKTQMPGSLIPLTAGVGVPPRLTSREIQRLAWTGAVVADRDGTKVPPVATVTGVPRSSARPDDIRVLLVDDNLATLAHVSTALAPGCDIVGATRDGHAALAAARESSPDVVVLDISMPGMNGFELARQLRGVVPKAALVFLTVHDEHEFMAAARDVGALGYVAKPRLAVDLLHAVREAHSGRSVYPR
jgi:CheY-like chemotaxis protein